MASEVQNFFQSFYEGFVLRDLLGKIVPGGIVLASIAGALFSSPGYRLKDLNELEAPIWIALIGVCWLIGFAVQGLGELFGYIAYYPRQGNWLYKIVTDWLYKSGPEAASTDWLQAKKQLQNSPSVAEAKRILRGVMFNDDAEFTEFYIQVASFAKSTQQIEREIVLREACGNASLAFLLSAMVWLVAAWHKVGSTFYGVTLGAFILAGLLLGYMHSVNVRRQHLRMVEALNETSLNALRGIDPKEPWKCG
jgi:hypothetical protein